jgi:hypothetical protein
MRTAGRTRLAAAAALAAAAVVVVALLVTGGDSTGAALAWEGEKRVFQSGKPTDRVLTGQVKNTSLEDVTIDVEDIRLLDAEGREVQSTARFLAAFAHGRYPWSLRGDDPRALGSQERTLIGEMAKLRPGQVAPLTLSWRVPPGARPPVRVDFGSTSLALS